MRRAAWTLFLLSGVAAAADPPRGMTGGTAAVQTTNRIAPGGRGPARPRGEAFATPLPAAGRSVVQPVYPPFSGGPTLAKQPPIELVLFGKTRPVHIRIETQVKGKTLAAAWTEHVDAMFKTFDRNSDGSLNRYEFDYVFSPAGVVKLLQGKAYVPYQDGDPGPDFDAADKDKDNAVSPAELRAYYTEPVKQVVALDETADATTGPIVPSSAVLELLDKNGDGKVTAEECADARARIKMFDKNDDETLDPTEIPAAKAMAKPAIGRVMGGAGNPMTPMIAAVGRLPDTVAGQCLLHYDRDKNGLLTKAEFDLTLIAALDKNGDGSLNYDELLPWRDGEPDLFVLFSTGGMKEHCTVAITAPRGAALPAWAAVTSVRPGHAVLRVDGRVVEFSSPVGSNNNVPLDGDSDMEWPMLPNRPRHSAIREADLANQNQVFRIQFDQMDFDGNGVLTFAEYQKYMQIQRSTAGFPITVASRTKPVDLFKWLDENGDGKLSARELRTAFDKLAPLEPSGDPAITPAALKPTATFQVAQPSGADRSGSGSGGIPAPARRAEEVPVDETAPLWFRKMDANNDGEVSKREFLGTAEHFKSLDTNGDGIIGVEEAKAFDPKRK